MLTVDYLNLILATQSCRCEKYKSIKRVMAIKAKVAMIIDVLKMDR